MKVDFRNAPVTEPYARDLVLQAHQQLISEFPSGKDLVFVEFFEMPGFALVSEQGLVFYHPEMVKEVSLDNLVELLRMVMHTYMMRNVEQLDPEDLIVPTGTTLH